MFKRKTYEEVGRYYTPPPMGIKRIKSEAGSGEDILKYLLGFTTIEMRCKETGELHFYYEKGDLTE